MQGAILIVTALAVFCAGEPILRAQRLGSIYKGPDSETIISGPDGSVITAASVGGVVDTKGELGPGPVPGPGGPVIIAGEPDAEVLPIAVSPATTLIQHDPIIISSRPSPILHEVSRTLVSGNAPLVATHQNTATVLASNGLGSSATASVSSSGGVVTAHAKVSSPTLVVPQSVIKEVVTVVDPIAPPSVVVVPAVKEVFALEEPAPIIPIPEPPSVEVRAADTALIGPSGTISTKGGSAAINGPASLTISNNGVVSEAIKVDAVPVAVAPVVPVPIAPIRTVVETRPIVTEIVEPIRETIVVSSPRPEIVVQDIDVRRVDLGPQKFITETAQVQPQRVIVSDSYRPIVETNHGIDPNVAAAIEEERYLAQSLVPPRDPNREVLLRTVQGPPQHLIQPTQQRVTAEDVSGRQYVDTSYNVNPYQRSAFPNIPLHPPQNSVPAAILGREAVYSSNIVGRAPHL